MDKPIAYAYTRMSTLEQKKGDSYRRQMQRVDEYVAANNLALDTSRPFDDAGVSGYRGENAAVGELKRFLDLVDEKKIAPGSYLLVESMDRLSRDTVDRALTTLMDIIRKGIIVVTLENSRPAVYSSETLKDGIQSLMFALVDMSRAHNESAVKSDRLSAVWGKKMLAARTNLTPTTSRVPGWLRLDAASGKITVIEPRAEVVRRIFEMLRGGYGAYSIARAFNVEKLPRFSRGAVWQESYIKKISANRAVLGEYQPHHYEHSEGRRKRRVPQGDPVPGYFPAIVDDDLFAAATLAMQARKVTGRGRKGAKYSNLFTGLLKCFCGAGYTFFDKGMPPKGGRYLQCSNAHLKGDCRVQALRYEIVESTILRSLETLDIPRVLGGVPKSVRTSALDSNLLSLQTELRGLSAKATAFVDAMFADASAIPPTAKAKLTELDHQKTSLADQIGNVQRELEELNRLDPEARQIAIRELIGQINDEDGRPTNEKLRRLLAAELRKILELIRVKPNIRLAHEEIVADKNWRETFEVKTESALGRKLKSISFELSLLYRTGAVHFVDPIDGIKLRLPSSAKMNRLRYLTAREKANPS